MSAIDNSYKMDGDVSLVILFLFLSLFLSLSVIHVKYISLSALWRGRRFFRPFFSSPIFQYIDSHGAEGLGHPHNVQCTNADSFFRHSTKYIQKIICFALFIGQKTRRSTCLGQLLKNEFPTFLCIDSFQTFLFCRLVLSKSRFISIRANRRILSCTDMTDLVQYRALSNFILVKVHMNVLWHYYISNHLFLFFLLKFIFLWSVENLESY